jgi:hypothetical protein
MATETEQLAYAIHGIFIIVMAYIVWKVMIRSTAIEEFRQEMFNLRHRLFADRLDGKLETEEYDRLMAIVNVLIRYPKRYTFLRFIIALVSVKSRTKSKPVSEGKVEVEYSREISKNLLKYWAKTSIPMMEFVLLSIVAGMFWRGAKKARNYFAVSIGSIIDEIKLENRMMEACA